MKSPSSKFQLSLIFVWAILLFTFMVFRPVPRSFLFWALIIPAFLTGGAYMFLSRVESRRTIRDVSDWDRRLRASVDVWDFEDDGHLYEYFEPDERERLIHELDRMPRGFRSLRSAIEIVSPDLINEDA
jgi:hypothetical protein